jgi:hypothetical protein
MAEQWIIRVQGKDYGPADLETLQDWKADGRVLPANPARRMDLEHWQTASEIPGLFQVEQPPVQEEVGDQRSQVSEKPASRRPSRNILIETFRIYFRGFFQFLGLSLLSIVPIACAELTSRFIDTVPGVNVDLRTMVAAAFWLCMIVLWLVLWPIYIAGIQILSAELAAGRRLGFFSVLNDAVRYWPRVAALCIFVFIVFLLLTALGGILLPIAAAANTVLGAVVVLSLLVLQVWLFSRFFIKVLFWQQFAVLENLNAADALGASRKLARGGRDLPWYQRPVWRGALVVSVWFAFALGVAVLIMWPKVVAQWAFVHDAVNQLSSAQDPQLVWQKLAANMPKEQATTWSEVGLSVLQRLFRPLLGIAFVVLYLDSKPDIE